MLRKIFAYFYSRFELFAVGLLVFLIVSGLLLDRYASPPWKEVAPSLLSDTLVNFAIGVGLIVGLERRQKEREEALEREERELDNLRYLEMLAFSLGTTVKANMEIMILMARTVSSGQPVTVSNFGIPTLQSILLSPHSDLLDDTLRKNLSDYIVVLNTLALKLDSFDAAQGGKAELIKELKEIFSQSQHLYKYTQIIIKREV